MSDNNQREHCRAFIEYRCMLPEACPHFILDKSFIAGEGEEPECMSRAPVHCRCSSPAAQREAFQRLAGKQWTKCADEMPPEGEPVQVFIHYPKVLNLQVNGDILRLTLTKGRGGKLYWHDSDFVASVDIDNDYWQPLPAQPGEAGEDE